MGGNNKDYDQKHGLALYGPAEWSGDDAGDSTPLKIRIGIVGTGDGITEVNGLCRKLSERIINNFKQPIKAPPFPGIEKSFRAKLVLNDSWNVVLSSGEVQRILDIMNYDRRVKEAATIYADKVGNICRRDSKPDVIVCHQDSRLENSIGASTSPEEKNRTILSRQDRNRINRIKDNLSKHLFTFAPLDPEVQDMIEMQVQQDFRRQLKALCMDHDIPTQILAHSTITDIQKPPAPVIRNNTGNNRDDEGREVMKNQDAATIAWNLCAALYFKAGYSTWRISGLKEGTCYVGVSFYRDIESTNNDMRASLAQIFTDEGRGMVLRGDLFHWSESDGPNPHLSKDSALALLTDALKLYESHTGHKPSRVIVHKTSDYLEDEAKGFREAASEIPYHDFISMRKSRGLYMYRNGSEPPLRGTVVKLEQNRYLVYTVGYVPYLKSYPGPRIPHPIEIWKHEGDSSVEELVREVLALTRLNWNSTGFNSYLPITLQFARSVGSILTRVPKNSRIQNEYRYYM
ncbi:hypothetical protein [Nitrososphaera sp.]|uniref:argonaute/piwi family protein n=1 Tax=Nitrososphaera sp. TaxID=1971748 RepID=UPI0017BEB2B8|nr:hypothetical protein [Nitrososphaera sp.]NWG36707.1 hypothetical protein [Nitrososphaera sp.]